MSKSYFRTSPTSPSQHVHAIELPKEYKITQKPQVLFEKVTDDILAQFKEKTKEVKPLSSFFGKEGTDIKQEKF